MDSTVFPVMYVIYAGISGSTQGDKKEATPSRKTGIKIN